MASSAMVINQYSEIRERKKKYIIFGFVYLSFFLDNVLLTVVVPIIPDYLHSNSVQLLKNSPLFNSIPIQKDFIFDLDRNFFRPNLSQTIYLVKNIPVNPDFIRQKKLTNKTKSEESSNGIDLGNDEKLELDRENVQVGLLLSSKALVQLFLNPVVGWCTSKVGYKVPIFVGGVNLLLAAVLFAFGESASWLLLARCVQGVASACVGVAGLGLLADVFSGAERPKVIGLVLSSVALGVLVGYPFGGFLYEFANKSTPFLVIAFIIFCNLVMQLIYMDFGNVSQKDANLGLRIPRARLPGRSLRALCRDERVRAAATVVFVSTCALAVLEPCLPIWLMTHLKPKKWQLGTVFIPDSIGYLLGTNLFGLIAYKVGPWRVSIIALFAVGIAAITVPSARTLQQLLFPHFCLGLGIGAVDASLAPLLAERADGDSEDDNSESAGGDYGAVFALHQTAVSLAYFLAPFLGGELTHQFGFEFTMRVVGFANVAYATLLTWYIWKHDGQGQFQNRRLIETDSLNNNSMTEMTPVCHNTTIHLNNN